MKNNEKNEEKTQKKTETIVIVTRTSIIKSEHKTSIYLQIVLSFFLLECECPACIIMFEVMDVIIKAEEVSEMIFRKVKDIWQMIGCYYRVIIFMYVYDLLFLMD